MRINLDSINGIQKATGKNGSKLGGDRDHSR